MKNQPKGIDSYTFSFSLTKKYVMVPALMTIKCKPGWVKIDQEPTHSAVNRK